MDITIASIRKNYPEYSDLTDTELADKLHAKFEPDTNKSDFYKKIGAVEQASPGGWKDFSHLPDELRNLAGGAAGTLQNIGASGLEAGEWLTRAMAQKLLEEQGYKNAVVPKWNAREFAGLEGPNQVNLRNMIAVDPNSTTSQIGSLIPLLGGNAATLGKSAVQIGALAGAAAEPDQKLLSSHLPVVGQFAPEGRIPTAIETGLLTMLAPGAVNVASKLPAAVNNTVNKAGKYVFAGNMANNIEKELNKSIESLEKTKKARTESINDMTQNQVKSLQDEINNDAKKVSVYLGQGANSTDENAKAIADELRSLHDPRAANAASYYEYVLNQADKERKLGQSMGDNSRGLLYEKSTPLTSTKLQEGKQLKEAVAKHDFGEVGQAFINEDTLRNAHNLKQEVGFRANDIRQQLALNPPNAQQLRKELNQLDGMYAELKNDMNNYMLNRHPNQNENLMKQWETGDRIYQEEVLPFLYDKKLRAILRPGRTGGGREKYVSNIHEAFAHPEEQDIVLPTGEVQLGQPSKLLNMLSQGTKDRILFNKLGAPTGENANKLIDSINNAARNGYAHLPSPELKQGLQGILEKQMKIPEIEKAGKIEVNKLKDSIEQYIHKMKNETTPKINELRNKSRFIKRSIGRAVGIGLPAILTEELIRRNH